MDNGILNVIYSSDDKYAQHMGVSIYSLLEHNQDFQKINIFVIENKIREDNRQKLIKIAQSFSNAEMHWIDFTKWLSQLKLNMMWSISVSSYARLFVAGMLPESVDRVLYLDCDIIIRKSLKDLWQYDLGNNILGAVQDPISESVKSTVGLTVCDKYFNAGVLLIDLKKWREEKIEKRCLAYLNENNGNVYHHDQGILNNVLKDSKSILPMKYNIMTVFYIFNKKQFANYYYKKRNIGEFYSEEEIEEAKADPVILHFTPSFTSRPWYKNCRHPLRKYYTEALAKTPWAGTPLMKDDSNIKLKSVNFYYRHYLK